MWIYRLALLTTILSPAVLASETCTSVPSLGEVDNLAEVNCELVNQRNSCAKSPQDPNALRNGVTNLFNYAENERDKINRLWDSVFKKNIYGQLFNDERRKYNRDEPPQYILDWFKELQPELSSEVLKQNIIDSYVEFGQKHDCTPQILNRYVVRPLPVPKFRTEQESRNSIRDMSQFQDYINKGRGENAIKDLTVCTTQPQERHGPKKIVAYEFPPCTGNISQNFANNAWTINASEASSIAYSNVELTQCIQDRLNRGAKIHHVSVVASASALNNTGAAKERFCAKGFRELSQARAQSAVDMVLPRLIPDASMYAGDKLQINVSGSNGDGTSGECPYRLVDGREVLKPEFAPGGARRSELDSSRYVKIVVNFEEKMKSAQNNPDFYQPQLGCRQIHFKCRPN